MKTQWKRKKTDWKRWEEFNSQTIQPNLNTFENNGRNNHRKLGNVCFVCFSGVEFVKAKKVGGEMIDTHAHANERVFKLKNIAAYKCKLIQLECLKIMFTKCLKNLFDTDLTRPVVKQYKPKTTIICIIQWGQSIPLKQRK